MMAFAGAFTTKQQFMHPHCIVYYDKTWTKTVLICFTKIIAEQPSLTQYERLIYYMKEKWICYHPLITTSWCFFLILRNLGLNLGLPLVQLLKPKQDKIWVINKNMQIHSGITRDVQHFYGAVLTSFSGGFCYIWEGAVSERQWLTLLLLIVIAKAAFLSVWEYIFAKRLCTVLVMLKNIIW